MQERGAGHSEGCREGPRVCVWPSGLSDRPEDPLREGCEPQRSGLGLAGDEQSTGEATQQLGGQQALGKMPPETKRARLALQLPPGPGDPIPFSSILAGFTLFCCQNLTLLSPALVSSPWHMINQDLGLLWSPTW